jgi:hypothetical protein
LVTSADHLDAQVDLGTEVRLHDGRCFKYVQFNEAVTIGDCVTILMPDVTNSNLTAATSTSSVTIADTGWTASRYNGALTEWYFSTNGTDTGPGQTRRILSNTTTALTIDAAPSTALATDTDGVTYSPYMLELSDAADERVCGVALASQTTQYYGWVQQKGFCPLVQFAGNTDAAVAHEGIVSSGTAGEAKGLTNGGTTADEADKAFGYALYGYTASTVDSRGIAAMLNAY